ncbi:unnamed protein product, partial [Ectocarpus sp. 13 AM-2016]
MPRTPALRCKFRWESEEERRTEIWPLRVRVEVLAGGSWERKESHGDITAA